MFLVIVGVVFLLACKPVSKEAVKALPPTAEETDIAQELNDLDDLDTLVQETGDDLGLEELEGIDVE